MKNRSLARVESNPPKLFRHLKLTSNTRISHQSLWDLDFENWVFDSICDLVYPLNYLRVFAHVTKGVCSRKWSWIHTIQVIKPMHYCLKRFLWKSHCPVLSYLPQVLNSDYLPYKIWAQLLPACSDRQAWAPSLLCLITGRKSFVNWLRLSLNSCSLLSPNHVLLNPCAPSLLSAFDQKSVNPVANT